MKNKSLDALSASLHSQKGAIILESNGNSIQYFCSAVTGYASDDTGGGSGGLKVEGD